MDFFFNDILEQLSSEILVDLSFKRFKDLVVKSFFHVITVIKAGFYINTYTHIHTSYYFIYV